MTEEKIRVLVVEDEAGIRDGLCDVLTFHGYDVTGVETGEEGIEHALTAQFGVLLLDIMLPGIDGFSVCEKIRAELPQQLILILTAKGSEEDILTGFARGADDYVTKPFSVRQLVARVEALLRRAHQPQEDLFAFGPWDVDGAQLTARADGRQIELSRRELEMLQVFRREKGRIVSRRLLLRELWGFGNPECVNTRTVDMHIAKLRKKLADSEATLIQTIRGEGYRFG